MPQNADDTRKPTTESGPALEFHHIKGNFFRVVHVDGGLGGITPRGLCHLALYSERPAIPRVTVRDPTEEEGAFGPERNVEVRGDPNFGVVRELEVDLMFNEQTAREIRDWLNRRLEDFEKVRVTQAQGKGVIS